MCKKVKVKDFLLFIQLLLFLIPVGLLENKLIMVGWYAMLLMSMIIFVSRYHISKTKLINKTILPWMFLYLIIQAIATYKSNGNWEYGIMTLIIVSTFILYVEEAIKKNYSRFLKVFDYLLLTEIMLEIFVYMMGGDFLQQFACVYIYYSVWCCIHMLHLNMQNRSDMKIYIISVLLITITIIKPQMNSDGTVNFEWTFYIMALMCCWFYFFRSKTYQMYNIFNVKNFYIFILGFNLLFVVFQNFTDIPGISYIFEDVMHKDITLSGRTSIWLMAMGKIAQSPVWGYGSGFPKLVEARDFWTNWLGIHGPHNQFLAITLSGGFVTLSAYLLLIIKSTLPLHNIKKNNIETMISISLMITFIGLSITYRNIINCLPLFVVLVLSHNGNILMKSIIVKK